VVGWWQECFSWRGIAAQQAMCGSVRHRDAETTRDKLRTNKSHLQMVGQNRMNGSVRVSSVLFQFHDGHSSIILNHLSHFFNQRNSGNFLTALRKSCAVRGRSAFPWFPSVSPTNCSVRHSTSNYTNIVSFQILSPHLLLTKVLTIQYLIFAAVGPSSI